MPNQDPRPFNNRPRQIIFTIASLFFHKPLNTRMYLHLVYHDCSPDQRAGLGTPVHFQTATTANDQAHHNRLDRIFCLHSVDGANVDRGDQSSDHTTDFQTNGAFEIRRDRRAG